MPEEIPEGAPYHPYDNPREADKLSLNRPFAKKFWSYIKSPETHYENITLPNLTRNELTPKRVGELFNAYREDLFQQRKENDHLLPGRGGKGLEEFSLYDVYLMGFWDTHRSDIYGIPANERPDWEIGKTAQKEQSLTLVEEAMKLASHIPEEDIPKLL